MTETPDNTNKNNSENTDHQFTPPQPPPPVGPNGELNYRDTPIDVGGAFKELGRNLLSFNRNGVSSLKWGSIISTILAFMLANTSNGFSLMAFFIWLTIFWAIRAPFRAASWVANRANSRPCPVCGIRIRNGETVCGSCGTDFKQR